MMTSKIDIPLMEGVREGNDRLIKLTEASIGKIASLGEREVGDKNYLRLGISGGGCNGLSYKMRFVAEPKQGDILIRSGNVLLLIDSKSALYLKGTHLDYSDALISGGFKFSNPNAKSSCSCGESFSI
jgi:iron-sulfur cluster assembly protein